METPFIGLIAAAVLSAAAIVVRATGDVCGPAPAAPRTEHPLSAAPSARTRPNR